jgi:hypothetical protein
MCLGERMHQAEGQRSRAKLILSAAITRAILFGAARMHRHRRARLSVELPERVKRLQLTHSVALRCGGLADGMSSAISNLLVGRVQVGMTLAHVLHRGRA